MIQSCEVSLEFFFKSTTPKKKQSHFGDTSDIVAGIFTLKKVSIWIFAGTSSVFCLPGWRFNSSCMFDIAENTASNLWVSTNPRRGGSTSRSKRGRIFNSSGARQTLEVEFKDSESATDALMKLMGHKMDNSVQQSPAQSNSSSVEIGSSNSALPVPTALEWSTAWIASNHHPADLEVIDRVFPTAVSRATQLDLIKRWPPPKDPRFWGGSWTGVITV